MPENFFYFDLGNVLVKFDHSIAVKQVAELAKCRIDDAQRVLFESGLQHKYETGLITSQQYADQVNAQLQTEIGTADILEAVSAIFTPNGEILSVLQHIKSTGVRIGLLSNTCEAHWHWLLRQAWPMIHGWFDPLVLSYEIRCMKPDRAIYEHCEEVCGCQGSRIFFTDDRADNIAAANEMGWATYQYGTTQKLLERFEDWRLQFA